MPVVDKVADAVFQRELLGTTVCNGYAVHCEGALQIGEFEKFVAYYVGISLTLDVNDNAHAFSVRLIIYIADTINLLLVHQCSNLLDEFRFVDIVWDFTHDNLVMSSF